MMERAARIGGFCGSPSPGIVTGAVYVAASAPSHAKYVHVGTPAGAVASAIVGEAVYQPLSPSVPPESSWAVAIFGFAVSRFQKRLSD